MIRYTLKAIKLSEDSPDKIYLYVGYPRKGYHPIAHQLITNKNHFMITANQQAIDSFGELGKIAHDNNVPVTELFEYALESSSVMEAADADLYSETIISLDTALGLKSKANELHRNISITH